VNDSTNEAMSRWRARQQDPNYKPPRYEPKLKKKRGSLELVLGEWMLVN
jgi:hypothetical protein